MCRSSLVAQTVKRLPVMQEIWVWSLGQEDPLEREMATHSSILAWRIPRTEERGRLQSMDGKESDTTKRLHFHFLSVHVYMCVLTHVWLFVTPWTVAPWAPLSKGFSRQEYWSGLPFPSPGHLTTLWVEAVSLASPALAGEFLTTWATWEALTSCKFEIPGTPSSGLIICRSGSQNLGKAVCLLNYKFFVKG